MRDMTVKELRDYLQTLPDDMKVGVEGHCGEFWRLATDTNEFEVKETYVDDYVRVGRGLFEKKRKYFQALILPVINIGPEPD